MRPPRAKRRTPARVSATTDEIYRIAFEGASELLVVIRVSPRGTFHIERMNPSAVAYFARTLPEITAADIGRADMATLLRRKARLTREQVASALAPHREAVRTRGPVSNTSEICTGTGERLTRQFTITPVADKRGRVTRLLYRGMDITGLRSAEERFAQLFELSPVPLSIVRLADSVRLQANDAWLSFHGRTRAQAVGRSARVRTVWADPAERERMIETLRQGGRAGGRMTRLVTENGATRDAVVSMTRIVWEGDECMITATLDVSELEATRREAQASSERFIKLFDLSPVPLSIVRLSDGVRQQANAAWLALHGRARDEAVSQSAPARTVWADPELRASMIETLQRDGHVPGRLAQLVAAGGVVRDTMVSMTRIVWEGEACMVVATLDVSELEAARRLAQASSARFTKLFELSPVPIVIGRLSDGAYLAANAAWLGLHGYRREELDGQTSLTLRAWLSPEDRARVVEILRREGELKAMPVKFRAKSGATIDTLYYATLVEWDGETAIVAAPQDITELVRTRREADTQTERFKALFRLSPSPSSVTTLNDGRYLAVNSSWAGAMGYAPEEMLDRRALDLGIWPDAGERTRFVSELKTHGTLRQMPVRFRTRRGDVRQMQISSELIQWSGVPAILSSMYDVTDLERARSEAQASSERFLRLFESNPVPIIITRIPDGTLLEVNLAWLELKGMTREEALGQTTLGMGSWVDRALRDKVVADIAGGLTYSNFPVQLRARGDDVRDILYSGARVDWLGQPAIVAFLVDVTDITRAGEEIRNLNESLEQKVLERTAELEAANRELESFSYSVSHDLRSPLGAINGFAHVLRAQESGRLSADGDRLLGLLERDAERMALLVDGLLDFSRLGRKPVAKSAVAMAELAAGVADELRGKHDARRAQIRTGPLPACGGDPMLLRQVWWNLLDNALKYSRRRDPALLEVGYDSAAGAYFVRDNGVGFDMRHAGKLFGVFERLHADSEFEGTGIGLATAARIVLRHGGRIWCDAAPDRGATFYFSLPA